MFASDDQAKIEAVMQQTSALYRGTITGGLSPEEASEYVKDSLENDQDADEEELEDSDEDDQDDVDDEDQGEHDDDDQGEHEGQNEGHDGEGEGDND